MGSYELDTTKAVFGDFNNDNKIDVNDVYGFADVYFKRT